MSAPTTRDAFALLMREHLGPALRAEGFNGSGGVYRLPDPRHWAQVGVQRSVHGDRRETRFTINLSVVSKPAWDAARADRPYLPDRPAPNTRYGLPVWHSRIGLLLPAAIDAWWTLRPESDLPTLAAEVLAALRDHGLPAIRARLT